MTMSVTGSMRPTSPGVAPRRTTSRIGMSTARSARRESSDAQRENTSCITSTVTRLIGGGPPQYRSKASNTERTFIS
jgi:hypothetical protein